MVFVMCDIEICRKKNSVLFKFLRRIARNRVRVEGENESIWIWMVFIGRMRNNRPYLGRLELLNPIWGTVYVIRCRVCVHYT